MSDTKTKFGLALVSVLLATSGFAGDKETTNLSFTDLVSSKYQLLDTNGTKVSREVLKGKFVGVYFSAQWCGPCRNFTPVLQKFRDANAENFEVVFLSLDYDRRNTSPARCLEKKREYMKSAKMDWYTINCGYMPARRSLTKTGRRGIPTLVVFSPDGKCITTTAKVELKNPESAMDVWKKASSIK
jgi:nucleoredoxin